MPRKGATSGSLSEYSRFTKGENVEAPSSRSRNRSPQSTSTTQATNQTSRVQGKDADDHAPVARSGASPRSLVGGIGCSMIHNRPFHMPLLELEIQIATRARHHFQ